MHNARWEKPERYGEKGSNSTAIDLREALNSSGALRGCSDRSHHNFRRQALTIAEHSIGSGFFYL